MNFQITTNDDSKLSYTPCYTQLFKLKFKNMDIKKLKKEELLKMRDEINSQFNYGAIDFVIVLNENTGKFARCFSVKDVENFLNAL